MAQIAAAARAAKATRSAPTSASATPATTQRASRVRNATAPPPPSSSSVPPKTFKDTNKRRGTATRTGSTSMAAPALETPEFYEARAIIDEEGSQYLIDWEGVDPATGAAYEPTWEPKRSANAALKREWEGKKAKGRAEQAKAGQAEARSQVTAGQSKVQRNTARNATAQKATASNRPLRTREQRIGTEAQHREVRKKNQTGPPSTQDSKHKSDAGHEAQQSRLREPLGRNLKRKRDTDAAADKAKPWSTATRSQPQQNNKRQRRQPAEPPLESPSEQVFPARAITGERPRQYRVAWEKDPVTGEEYEDTWEPKSYVSRDLVAEWRRQQKGMSQKASTKQRKQPAKKAHESQDEQQQEEPDDNVYSVRAIVGERKRQYLVAWEDDPTTGEKFEDTWEPKGNVSKDVVAEWRQQKDTKRPGETSKQPEETSKQPVETSKQPVETSKQPVETPKWSEETPKWPEETPKRLKEPAQKPPEVSPATAGLSEMVMEVLREEEQRQHSPSLPIGPVTPRRDEDEDEEDEEEGSYTPSSTMVHTAAPVAGDVTMEPHTTTD
ncbi:Chromo domain-containing protein [Lasiodiplodia theobromae]|uniref:Chromo domain-containing protein n=1 Tax=Lasiodiplodia theobromae TaxID=45133 RepID=UPI0015C33CA9|nr:Chromo domain-containing protein [Lasiodiplodia theobromae]KAF4544082.1 Chromo domain-containing protein [Lasiodiplodia theobromae]